MKWVFLSAILALLLMAEAREKQDGRIVAAYSTKTAYSITTSTTIVPYTCHNGLNGNPCKKRRRRMRSQLDTSLHSSDYASSILETSLADDSELIHHEDEDVGDKEGALRSGRIAITIWTTQSSTHTVTLTSTNTALTFSVSYFCTFAGAQYAPACG